MTDSRPTSGSGAPSHAAGPLFARKRADGVRCVVEGVSAMCITGWAALPGIAAARIEIRAGGRQMQAAVRTVHRGDVLEHLGASASHPAQLGFSLEIPPEAWAHRQGHGPLELEMRIQGRGDDLPVISIGAADLLRWFDQVVGISRASARRAAWSKAEPHLRAGLPPAEWARAEAAWHKAEADHASHADGPDEELRWSIESVQFQKVTGWAASPNGDDDRFELACNGRKLPIQVVRHERLDVQQALGNVRLDSGFDLAIPSDIWAGPQDSSERDIQLVLNGRQLLTPPLKMGVADLAAAVEAWRAAPQPEEADERRFTTLLLYEHVSQAGAWPHLTPESAAHLAEEARLQGVEHAPVAQAGLDGDARTMDTGIWHLQRAFNAALDDEESRRTPLAALQALLATETAMALPPAVHRRFVASLIPYFCAIDQLGPLRALLDDDELELLAMSDGRWELSLLVPVSLLDDLTQAHGRVERTAHLMRRLAATDAKGWLETAAVHDTWKRLAGRLQEDSLDSAQTQDLLAASLELLQGLGDDHASRLYDEQLIAGAAWLVKAAQCMGEPALEKATHSVVQHYGLAPRFWQSLDAAWPERTQWPRALRSACDALEVLAASWQQTTLHEPPSQAARDALAHLRAGGCRAVDAFQRHLLPVHPAKDPTALGAPQAWLAGLPDEDQLRWLGRYPQNAEQWLPGRDFPRLLMRTGPVPPVAHPWLRDQAFEAWSHPSAGPAEAGGEHRHALAWRLCSAAHGFLGLRLLLETAHLEVVQQRAGRACADLLAAIQRTLGVCTRERHLHGTPPAPLASALNWWHWARKHGPVAARAALESSEWFDGAAQLAELWPGDAGACLAELPVACEVPVATPGSGLVVAVRLPERGPAGTSAEELPGWCTELGAHGIPWVTWVTSEAGAGPAGAATAGQMANQPKAHYKVGGLLQLLGKLAETSDFGQVLLVDADAVVSLRAWFSFSEAPTQHYHGSRTLLPRAATALKRDKSPADTTFAPIGTGLTLSRFAIVRALSLARSARGARLARDSFVPEKYLADLLRLASITLSNVGHAVHATRPPQAGQHIESFHGFLPPGPGSPAVLSHRAAPGQAETAGPSLLARRLWPADEKPRFGPPGRAAQLVELSEPAKADDLAHAACVVVAVARNECTLMPHFLAHYRSLGLKHFVIVDNLSDDGTREYLLAQPDVVVYSSDMAYSQSRYGVTWQQAVLAAHGRGRWSLLADIDEFLVWPDCETEGIEALCRRLDAQGSQAARALMIDMYPAGALDLADFELQAPFQAAASFDHQAVRRWHLGSGHYSNSPSWVSGLRHRLVPDSPPNHYTSQKVVLMRYAPWVRCSEGLHYCSGLTTSAELLAFAHFKYHSGFAEKVRQEVARGEHYNGAEEYRRYSRMLARSAGVLSGANVSSPYLNSRSFSHLLS